MSTDYTLIQQAFVTKLVTLTLLPPVVYENKDYPDIKQGKFLSVQYFPSIPEYPELGNTAQAYETGYFVVTVYVQAGSGWKEASDLANSVVALFTRNLVITYSTCSVKIKKSYRLQSDVQDGVYQLPVFIQYEGWF